MIQTHNNAVPSVIQRKLRSIRLRQTGLILLRGLAIAIAVFVAAMVLAMTIDWVFTIFSATVRVALTGLAVVLSLMAFAVNVVSPLRRTFGRTQPAADADAAIPQLEERWTTVASFANSGEKPDSPMSQRMLDQVNSEAVAMQRLVRPSIVVRPASLKRPAMWLGACVLLLAGFLLIDLPRTTVLVKRFLSPTAPITATQLVSESGDIIIPRGEMFDIVASATGIVRESVTLAIEHESGVIDVLEVPGDSDDTKRFAHAMRADDSLRYQVTSGDARTEWHRVTVIDHPTLEEVQFQVTPPSYIDQPAIEKTLIPSRLRVPQGSVLEVAMKPSTDLESLTIDLEIPSVEGEPQRKSVSLRPNKQGWYRFRTQLLSDVSFRPTLRNVFGLENEDKRVCHIEVIVDRAPVARIINSDAELAVADDEEIEIEFEAHDDHGVKTAELVIYDETATEEGEEPKILEVREIPLGDQQDQQHVKASTKLDLKELNLPEGAKISYSVRVTDNRKVEIDPEMMLAATDTQPDEESADTKSESKQASKSENTDRELAMAEPSEAMKNDTTAEPNSIDEPATDSQTTVAQSDTSDKKSDAKPGEKSTSEENTENLAQAETPGKMDDEENGTRKNADAKSSSSKTSEESEADPSAEDPTQVASAENMKPKTGSEQADTATENADKDAETVADDGKASPSDQPNSEPKSTESENVKVARNSTKKTDGDPESEVDDSEKVAAADANPPMADNENKPADADNDTGKSTADSEMPTVAQADPSDGKLTDDSKTSDENNTVADAESKTPMSEDDSKTSDAGNNLAGQPRDAKTPSVAQSDSADDQPMPNDDPQTAEKTESEDANPEESSPDKTPKIANAKPTATGSAKSRKRRSPSESEPPIPVDVRLMAQQSESGQNTETNKRQLKITKRLASVAKSDAERKEDERIGIREKVVAIDVMLAEVQTRLTQILNREIPDSEHRPAFQEIDDRLGDVETYVSELREETAEGEFAFIGLQMVDITRTYVTPARDRVFRAIRDAAGAEGHTKAATGHITRAREMLAALLAQYDKVAQEKKLAESIEETAEIYEVYVEKMQKLMRERRQNKNPLKRAMAVIEVDQDYLDRLAEVITLRREMMREFGRMLSDDPRLLARYMDLLKRRNKSLRDQLSDLSERQEEVAYELAGWQSVDEAGRVDVWTIVIEMRLLAAEELAKESAALAERVHKQLPLTLEPSHPVAARVLAETDRMAQLAQEIAFDAELFLTATPDDPQLQEALGRTRQLTASFNDLDAALDQLIVENEGDEDTATYVNSRLRESRSVADQAERWEQIAKAIQARSYYGLNELDQWQLNTTTELLRVDMLEFEDELQGQFQQQANSDIPGEIVDMIRQLHRLMETITFNQSAATFALKRDRGEFAEEQQAEAVKNLALAEDLFDKIRRAVIAELDQYEIDDPNIANLRDPTLDQFLANLEREPNIQAQLGIPRRPTNLRIRADNLFQAESGMLQSSSEAAESRAKNAMKMARDRNRNGKEDEQENQKSGEMTPEEKEKMEKAKRMQETLAKSMAAIEDKLKDPKTPPAEKRRLEQMKQNLERVRQQLDENATSAEEWDKIVEQDQAAEMLKALANGERIPDEQWNKLMSTLEDGLWQVRGTQPPEEYRRAIEQYQDRLRELMSTTPVGGE